VGLDHGEVYARMAIGAAPLLQFAMPVTEVSLPLEVAMGPSPCSTWCQSESFGEPSRVSGRVSLRNRPVTRLGSPKTLDSCEILPASFVSYRRGILSMLGTPTHERNMDMSYVKSAGWRSTLRGAIGRGTP